MLQLSERQTHGRMEGWGPECNEATAGSGWERGESVL